jgi:hypothetical protein
MTEKMRGPASAATDTDPERATSISRTHRYHDGKLGSINKASISNNTKGATKSRRRAGAPKPASDPSDVRSEIARLETLDQLDYERQRVAAANKLCMRVSGISACETDIGG